MSTATILGLDPGLATTGYAIVRQQAAHIAAVEWGIIETAKDAALPRRLTDIARDLEKLLRRFQPDTAVVESVYFATNKKTAIQVAQARGVLLLTLARRHIPIRELTPLQLKSAITSYGAAPKAQVQTMVKKLLHLSANPKPDDAADALALALVGCLQKHAPPSD